MSCLTGLAVLSRSTKRLVSMLSARPEQGNPALVGRGVVIPMPDEVQHMPAVSQIS
jgi:hypothetical protein